MVIKYLHVVLLLEVLETNIWWTRDVCGGVVDFREQERTTFPLHCPARTEHNHSAPGKI